MIIIPFCKILFWEKGKDMPILKVKNIYDGTLVVRYHGSPCPYDVADDPSVLTKDALYLVDYIYVYPCDTEFFLRGFSGTYNSVCFEEVGVLDGTPATIIQTM